LLDGSGATFLANSLYSLTDESTSLRYNDTKFGYIPDGGSIYNLSRMTGEVGTFLALTGYKLQQGDIHRLKISDGSISDLDNLKEHLTTMLNYRNLNFSVNTCDLGFNTFENNFEAMKKMKHEDNPFGIHDVLSTNGKMKLNYMDNKLKAPFSYPWEKSYNDLSDNSDFTTTSFTNIFNKEFDEDDKSFNSKNSYRNFKRTYTNTLMNFEEQILYGVLENRNELGNLDIYLQGINKYFRFNSIKEILRELDDNRQYDSFAEICFNAINQRSLIANQVTLSLIRRAKNLNYEQTQRLEMNAAKNIIMKNPDFDAYFKTDSSKKNPKKFNKDANKIFLKIEEISNDLVTEILESDSGTNNIELELKKNSLLPTKNFRENFPDAFRLWINENPRANAKIREFFNYETRHYLMEKLGIDMRNTNLTIEQVREKIAKIYTKEFSENKTIEKVSNLLNDKIFLEEFLEVRKDYCNEYLKNADNIPKLKELITNKTNEIFEKSFKLTCNNILRKCRDIRDVEKRRTWSKLKKWIFSNRIMTYKEKERYIQKLRIDSLGNKSMHIPLDESKSWRDEINPNVKKSFFYKLAGTFKLKNITPETALKFAVSDYNSKKLFEFLEINEEKIKEIRDIVQNNPKDLTDIFASELDIETKELFDSIEEKDLLEYERLYRIRNEGQSPIDKMNFVDEFKFLKKRWMDFKESTTMILRQITLDTIFEIVENKNLYEKNFLEKLANNTNNTNNELDNDNDNDNDLEEYKNLFNVVKREKEDFDYLNLKQNEIENIFNEMNNSKTNLNIINLSEKEINNLYNNIKKSFENSNEKIFKEISQNLESENDFINKFSNKSYDLTKSLILHFLLNNKKINSSNNNNDSNKSISQKEPLRIEDFNINETLKDLFSYENFVESENLKKNNFNKLMHYVYIKHGSINLFIDALKSSKNTSIEILDQITESEIYNHYSDILKKIPEDKTKKIQQIYQTEKILYENLLKQYYEMKINLQKLEILQNDNSSNEDTYVPFEYKDIDSFIGKLQDIAFHEFILSDRSKSCPVDINLLLKQDYTENSTMDKKHKKLIELYVTLKENILQEDNKFALNSLSRNIKNTKWFNLLEDYLQNSKDGISFKNLIDLDNKNIDQNLENLMKNKFKDFIYEENSEADKNKSTINKDTLNNISNSRFNFDFVEEIINKYKFDKIKLNENIYDKGLMKKEKIFANKNELNRIKIKLTDKINEFTKNYNVNELSKKYIDYTYNSDFHIHRILCNIEDLNEFYNLENSPDKLNEMNNFISYGNYLQNFKKIINEYKKESLVNRENYNDNYKFTKKNSISANFQKLENLRNLSFNQNQYVKDLETAENFLKNREFYLEKIYNEFYGGFSFTEKYQVNSLANNIQVDFEGLYNYLQNRNNDIKSINLNNNFDKFILSNTEFYSNFPNLNFDEFLGVDNLKLIQKRIDEINKSLLIEENELSDNGINIKTEKEIKNLIRNLVVEEITKTQNFELSNEQKLDKIIGDLFAKENQITKEISQNGFNLRCEDIGNINNSLETKELITEYMIKFKNFYSANPNPNNNSNSNNKTLNNPHYNFNTKQNNDNINLPKIFQEKISSKLFSLNQLSKITNNNTNKANGETKDKSIIKQINSTEFNMQNIPDLNSSEIDLNNLTLDEYLNNFKDFGQKYNSAIKYLSGEKLSLRDILVKGFDKTFMDYSSSKLNQIFTEKIPADLIKSAFEVLDAKMIKAIKILNADLLIKKTSSSDKEKKILSNILDNLKEINKEKKSLQRMNNAMGEFFAPEDFMYLENHRHELFDELEERNSVPHEEESMNKDDMDSYLLKKYEKNLDMEKEDDKAFEALDEFIQIRKDSTKDILNVNKNNSNNSNDTNNTNTNTNNENNKFNKNIILDLNITDAVKNAEYEKAIEKENLKKKRNKEMKEKEGDNKIENQNQNQNQDENASRDSMKENEDIYKQDNINQNETNFTSNITNITEDGLRKIYLDKLQNLVEVPNFSNKYTTLKYIYDYYMGTLSTDYYSHFEDAEERLHLINESVYLDRIEKTYFSKLNLKKFKSGAGILNDDYYKKIYDQSNLENLLDEKDGKFTLTNYEKSDLNNILEEEIFHYKDDKINFGYLSSEKEMKILDNYRNFAFDFIKESHPERLVFPASEKYYNKIMRYEMNKFVENYTYQKLIKDKKKDETYENFQANLLTTTEKFRNEASKNNQKNLEISEMPFNANEGPIGFDKLKNKNENIEKILNDNNKETFNKFNSFIESSFENYLQTKKDKYKFEKNKLEELKQNISHTGNLLSTKNPYELLKLSNQEYIEFKNYKDSPLLPNIPDTVNPNAPLKLDINSFLKLNTIQKQYPEFDDTDLTEIVDLDNAASFANFGKYSILPSWLVDKAEEENAENYLEKYLNSTKEQFLEYIVEEIVEEFYLLRNQVEKNLTREELKAFDLENINYFTFDNIKNLINFKINEFRLNIHLAQDEGCANEDSEANYYINAGKFDNKMYYHNHNLKNEDAFYRSVAYRMRLDKIKKDKIEKHFRSSETVSKKIPKTIKHDLEDDDGFESWYYTNLQNEKYRKNENSISRDEIKKEYDRKFFGYFNKKSTDANFTSESKIENAKFLLEYGDANLDKSKFFSFFYLIFQFFSFFLLIFILGEKVSRLRANDVIKELKRNTDNYDLSGEILNFFNDKI
jgi:enoyl-CoA hydratase/carnithine racemase